MELLLPLLLAAFPNMLPSTFEDPHQRQAQQERWLAKQALMAGFLRQGLQQAAGRVLGKVRRCCQPGCGASALLALAVPPGICCRSPWRICLHPGQLRPTSQAAKGDNQAQPKKSDIVAAAPAFQQQLALAQLPRDQLQTLCEFVGLASSGSSSRLAARLEAWLRSTRADDDAIRAEGLEGLDEQELQQACR
jgi:LETM1 and EF-hand domain-containing protein 1